MLIQAGGGSSSFHAKKVVISDAPDRTEVKNRLKKLIYVALSEYTGKQLPWGTLTGIRPTKIPMTMLLEGTNEEQILSYMKDTYLVSEEKAGLALEIAEREKELLSTIHYQDGYSLYIGIPFCPTTCLYCSFTSFPIVSWKKRVSEYLEAVEKEITFTAEIYKDKVLDTVYIGGGTPTTLEPYQLDRLLTKIQSCFDTEHLQEFTVEAGRPDSITREKLQVLLDHGIDRISINPQTMNQKTLDIIGRRHTVVQVQEAFALAREMGFSHINMDLIVGLPGETYEDVERTLQEVQRMAPDSVTVHSLAIKRAARLSLFKDKYEEMGLENNMQIMDMTARYCAEMELSPYYLYRQKNMAGNFENVGYAKVDKAGIYNILIMEEKQTILAAGAGASTKVVLPSDQPEVMESRIERCENVKDVSQYIERIDEMIERKEQFFCKNGI